MGLEHEDGGGSIWRGEKKLEKEVIYKLFFYLRCMAAAVVAYNAVTRSNNDGNGKNNRVQEESGGRRVE
jgi:hypothetical protein